jgi:hypothetical protein
MLLIRNWKAGLLLLLISLIITAGLYYSPIQTGDDWETFHGASWRILLGKPLYGEMVTFAYFSNPPWVAIAFIPLSLLPLRLGWSFICLLSMLAVLILAKRWGLSLVKTALSLASPSMAYIILHGQIDSLILAGVCLTYEFYPLLAFSKPQVAIGLLFGIPKNYWLRSTLLFMIILIISIFLFGFWLVEIIQQPRPFTLGAHNLWLGLFPFQVPVGVLLILWGISRSDEKFLLAGSPFLAPYATTSSLIGPWMAINYFLNDWQALIVWLSWWGAVLFRAL